MKILQKLLFGVGTLFTTLSAQAQFISPVNPETAYPDWTMGIVMRPDHVSCHGFHYDSGHFYAYSQNNIAYSNSINASISYLYMDPTNMVIYDQNTITFNNALDLEVGTLEYNGSKIVLASYYNPNGVFLDVYEYIFGTGLVLINQHQLSNSGKRPRIDSHKGYAAAITWEENNRIMVAAYESSGIISNPITLVGSNSGSIPDVAFGHNNDLFVRIAYFHEPSNSIRVSHEKFYNILSASGGMTFVTDDVQSGIKTDYIDIDGPDHSTDDRWVYVYNEWGNRIRAVSYIPGLAATPFVFDITDPSIYYLKSKKPSVAYSANSDRFHVAWSNNSNSTTVEQHYLSVIRRVDGAYITPYGNYMLVANTTDYGYQNYIAISKSNEHTDDLFTTYSMHTSNYEMYYKFKNYSASTFSGIADQPISVQLKGLPNPYQNYFYLDSDNISSDDVLEVQVFDIMGRVIFNATGDFNKINYQLRQESGQFNTGHYIVNTKINGVLSQLKMIKE